jgi:hypothetical protein
MVRQILALLCISLALPLPCAAAEWTLRFDGIGPLRIGMRFDQANARAGHALARTDPRLMASPGCEQIAVEGHPGVALMFVDGVLARVDLWQPGLKTAGGVAVGDNAGRVMAVYPNAASAPNEYDDTERYLTVRLRERALAMRFETSHGKIAAIYVGRAKAVGYTEGCL